MALLVKVIHTIYRRIKHFLVIGSYIVNVKNQTTLHGGTGEGRSGFDGTKIVGVYHYITSYQRNRT